MIVSAPAYRTRLGIIGLALTALAGCSGVEAVFDTVVSPDGRHQLVVTVTEPPLGLGPHRVRVYVGSGSDDAVEVASTGLENDGVPFTARNIGVRWVSPTLALICLRPTDLPDRSIKVDVADEPRASETPGC